MKNSILPSPAFERALRLSAEGHRDQVRKGSGVPYVEHPMAVALILDRAGFDEAAVIAGLLHDLVEDTDVTLEQIRERASATGSPDLVAYGSEVKLDEHGRISGPGSTASGTTSRASPRHRTRRRRSSWPTSSTISPASASTWLDGRPVWETFHAGRDQVLWPITWRCSTPAGRTTPGWSRMAEECLDR